MLYHMSRCACGEVIHVRQILAELWTLTLRIFTHFSLSSQLLLHRCMDLNETWQGCCTTSLEVHVGKNLFFYKFWQSYGPWHLEFLCRLRSIAAHRDHFVRRLSVCACVCLSDSHTFLIVTHSYVSQATHAFLGMLPLCLHILACLLNSSYILAWIWIKVGRDVAPQV